MKTFFDIRAKATERINGIQNIMLEFMIAQMTETYSQPFQEFESM